METLDGNTSDLAYDLRQRYAKLVGDNMDFLNVSKKQKNFSQYFDDIEDLYALTKHKWKEEKKEINYETLRKRVVDLSNMHSSTWLNQSQDSQSINIIRKALQELEMYVYSKMNECNMFGKKYDDDEDDL